MSLKRREKINEHFSMRLNFRNMTTILLLSKALAPLTEGKDINPETVKSSFKKFVLKKNPNSAADVEAQEMEYHWGALHCLEDSEVELLANELKKHAS